MVAWPRLVEGDGAAVDVEGFGAFLAVVVEVLIFGVQGVVDLEGFGAGGGEAAVGIDAVAGVTGTDLAEDAVVGGPGAEVDVAEDARHIASVDIAQDAGQVVDVAASRECGRA